MNDNDFTQIDGLLDSSINAERLLEILSSFSIPASIDGGDLEIGGASNLSVNFDKGINTFRSEGGKCSEVLDQAKIIVAALSHNDIQYYIEVCDEDWEKIITFGDYGHN